LARTSRIIAASLFSWPKECPGMIVARERRQ
jgi:hypothetical protein